MKLIDVKDRPMLIGVDFDRTLTQGNVSYPAIGADAGAMPWLTMVGLLPRVELILWTMREGAALQDAFDWCGDRGLFFDDVNGHEQNWAMSEDKPSRKTFFDLLIDDCTMGIPMVLEKTAPHHVWGGEGILTEVRESYVDWVKVGPLMVQAIMGWIDTH